MPWANVIANEQAGFLVTESGAGYTWSGNSRLNRLTAWHNDPVCDPHARRFGSATKMQRVFWSPTPGPTPAPSEYGSATDSDIRFSSTTSHELSQEVTMFMARDEPVKLTRLRLVNQSRIERAAFAVFLPALGIWAAWRGKQPARLRRRIDAELASDLGDQPTPRAV